MKILVMCCPAMPFDVFVFNREDDYYQDSKNVMYADLFPAINHFNEEYNVDEIILSGNLDYITTIAARMKENLDKETDITLLEAKRTDISDKELEEKALSAEVE